MPRAWSRDGWIRAQSDELDELRRQADGAFRSAMDGLGVRHWKRDSATLLTLWHWAREWGASPVAVMEAAAGHYRRALRRKGPRLGFHLRNMVSENSRTRLAEVFGSLEGPSGRSGGPMTMKGYGGRIRRARGAQVLPGRRYRGGPGWSGHLVRKTRRRVRDFDYVPPELRRGQRHLALGLFDE